MKETRPAAAAAKIKSLSMKMLSFIQATNSSEWNYSQWIWSLKCAGPCTGLGPGTAELKKMHFLNFYCSTLKHQSNHI